MSKLIRPVIEHGSSEKAPNPAEHVRSVPIASALHSREWSLSSEPRGFTRHIVLINSGQGEITKGNRVITLDGPSVTWLYSNQNPRLKMQAGATGHLLGVSHAILAGGFGNHAESANLRYMIDQTFTLPIGDHQRETLKHSSGAIDHELRHGGRASWMILGAHFSLIAVEIWRLSGSEDVAMKSQGAISSILQQFRQLVEVNFRQHWTIQSYASEIGISHDRLHSICTRKLNRNPLELVHERLCHEGKLLLERSTLTVEQIALSLGFKDTAHFSHFFKKRTTLPPSRYRQNILNAGAVHPDLLPETFADWP